MRHAGPGSLDDLEPLLAELRALPGMREQQRGIFYRRSRAFLHFHEDPAGLFADIRLGGDFDRWPVGTAAERRYLLGLARRAAGAHPNP